MRLTVAGSPSVMRRRALHIRLCPACQVKERDVNVGSPALPSYSCNRVIRAGCKGFDYTFILENRVVRIMGRQMKHVLQAGPRKGPNGLSPPPPHLLPPRQQQ